MLHIDIGKQLGFDIDDETYAKLFAHANVRAHVDYIGLRNILMDSHASAKRELFEDEIAWRNASKAMAEKKLAAMLAGEIRANSSGPRMSSKSPIEQEAIKLARVYILGKLREKPELIESYRLALKCPAEYSEKEVKNVAIHARAQRPDVIATATANVKAASELIAAQSTDDLGL